MHFNFGIDNGLTGFNWLLGCWFLPLILSRVLKKGQINGSPKAKMATRLAKEEKWENRIKVNFLCIRSRTNFLNQFIESIPSHVPLRAIGPFHPFACSFAMVFCTDSVKHEPDGRHVKQRVGSKLVVNNSTHVVFCDSNKYLDQFLWNFLCWWFPSWRCFCSAFALIDPSIICLNKTRFWEHHKESFSGHWLEDKCGNDRIKAGILLSLSYTLFALLFCEQGHYLSLFLCVSAFLTYITPNNMSSHGQNEIFKWINEARP